MQTFTREKLSIYYFVYYTTLKHVFYIFCFRNSFDIRRESGVSLVSGVYEEIPDLPTPPKEFQNKDHHISHDYEDPIELILGTSQKPGRCCIPPPLPPRQDAMRKDSFSDEGVDLAALSPPTTPEVKKSKVPFTIGCESEYMVMTPTRNQTDTIYTPMNSGCNCGKENEYMVMNGSKN